MWVLPQAKGRGKALEIRYISYIKHIALTSLLPSFLLPSSPPSSFPSLLLTLSLLPIYPLPHPYHFPLSLLPLFFPSSSSFFPPPPHSLPSPSPPLLASLPPPHLSLFSPSSSSPPPLTFPSSPPPLTFLLLSPSLSPPPSPPVPPCHLTSFDHQPIPSTFKCTLSVCSYYQESLKLIILCLFL